MTSLDAGTGKAMQEAEVVELARDLIRMDTSNFGPGKSHGEQEATDYARAFLEEVGFDCQVFAPAKGRTNLVTRWEGRDPDLPALLLHGHLDVVPADPDQWTVDPFGADLQDGMIWGRGAVDMKGTDAMILAAVREMARNGEQPQRDVVISFFADEESGGDFGSAWMVAEHPELFKGVTDAISEVGGYSVDIAGRRAYLLQTGEKGVMWVRLTAKGRASHGSQVTDANANVRLAEAVARIGRAEWPVSLTDTTSDLLERVRILARLPEGTDTVEIVEATGFGARFVAPSLRNVTNVTILAGGYKENVVPERATALVDVRYLPGQREDVLDRLQELAGPDVSIDVEKDYSAMEHPFEGPLVGQICETIHRLDPGAEVLPYLLPASTDNKLLSRLGIRGYGFAPLRLPADLDFPSMFHGVDERIPTDSLVFGQQVLADLIRSY